MKIPKVCPICANKLKSAQNPDEFVQLTCRDAPAHYISFITKEKKILNIYLVLDDYSAIEIRFPFKQTIYYYNPSNSNQFLTIPKLLTPDFPSLVKLKQKLSTLRVFI